jgi:predicted PhzF superfamily epimerase YddE/YHI9
VLNQQSPRGLGPGKGAFITKAGRIPICRSGPNGAVRADIPHNVHIHKHRIGDLQGPIAGLSQHRGLKKAEMKAPIVSIVKGMTFLLVELESLEMLGLVESSTELNFHGLLDGGGWQVGFVARYYYVVESEGQRLVNGDGTDGKGRDERVVRVRTRMLELTMEDPATGSAACALGSYLALKEGRTSRFEVTQGVEMGRMSVISVEVVVSEEGKKVESVRLSGSAVQVMEGSLRT